LEIDLTDGRIVAASHDSGIPASDVGEQGRRLVEKFMALASPVIGEAKARDLVVQIGELRPADKLLRIMQLCAAS